MEMLVLGPNLLWEARGQLSWQLPDPVFDSGVTPGPFSRNQLSWSREGSQSQHVFGLLAVHLDIGAELDRWWKDG